MSDKKTKRTPQEIIQRIRENGSSKELITDLWFVCKGFIHQQALKYIQRHDLDLKLIDDMMQDSYFEFLHALKNYDPEKGAFLTCLGYYLPNAFHLSAYGKRTNDGGTAPQDRFEQAARQQSLDEPLTEEPDSRRYGETIEDHHATAELEAVEDSMYQEQLSEAMDSFLNDSLTPSKREVIRRLYWEQQNQSEAAADMGITHQGVQLAHKVALQRLRDKMPYTESGKEVLAMCDDLAWRHFGTAAINSGKRETEENALARISKIEKFLSED